MNSHGNLEDTHTMTWQTSPESITKRLHISVTISDEETSFNASQSITKTNPETQIPETIIKVAQAAAALYGTQTWANLQKLLPLDPMQRQPTQPGTND